MRADAIEGNADSPVLVAARIVIHVARRPTGQVKRLSDCPEEDFPAHISRLFQRPAYGELLDCSVPVPHVRCFPKDDSESLQTGT